VNTGLSESEVYSFLQQVESGDVVLTPLFPPQYIYAGHVRYEASNGWRITVFNDCNQWDLIDEVIASDGRKVQYHEIAEWPTLGNYYPTEQVCWERYGIPGYLKFRCVQCGRALPFPDYIPPRKGKDYRCPDCIAVAVPQAGA
jgi:DNA-directed RNA polymerase subunit RPC12/RpoP